VFRTSSSGDDVARAPHGVAEPERRLLPCEAHRAGCGLVTLEQVHFGLLRALAQCRVELEHPVEMILDHTLVPAGDEHKVLDPGLTRFVDDILDQRPVDDGEHFLRHGLGRGEDAGAEAGDREHSFADFHAVSSSKSGGSGCGW
jgi:hypothetical protein